MKRKGLSIFLAAVLCMSLLTVDVGATELANVSLENVGFYKTAEEVDTEIYVVEAANIVAKANIVSDTAVTACVITAAYVDNKLTAVNYAGNIPLAVGETPYVSSPLNVADAENAEVKVMVWGSDIKPLAKAEILNDKSRDTGLSAASISLLSGAYTYSGLIDNESKEISFYVPNESYANASTINPYQIGTDYATAVASANIAATSRDSAATVSNGAESVTVTSANGYKTTYSIKVAPKTIVNAQNFDAAVMRQSEQDRWNLPSYQGVVGTGAWYWRKMNDEGNASGIDPDVTTEFVTLDETTGNKAFKLTKPNDNDTAVIQVLTNTTTPAGLNEKVVSFKIKIDSLSVPIGAYPGGISIGEYVGIVPLLTAKGAADGCFTFKNRMRTATKTKPNPASTNYYNIANAGNYALGEWHDFTFVYSDEAEPKEDATQYYTHTLKIYHNGVLATTQTENGVNSAMSLASGLFIGTYNMYGAGTATYTLDDLCWGCSK